MTYAREVTATLLGSDGTTVISGALDNAFDPSFMDELSGPGTGSISISMSESGAAQVIKGRYVRLSIGGTARFTFMIEGDPEIREIQEGEEFDQILVASGRGWGAVYDTSAVYPENMTLDLDTSWRLFSFASPDFPNAGSWSPAVELYEYLDGVTYGQRYQFVPGVEPAFYPSPVAFPLPTSPNIYDPDSPPGANYVPIYWIWSEQGESTDEYGIGWCFFRATLTIPDDQVYTFAITADNWFTLFLEGTPILGETTEMFMWRGWKEISTTLAAGTYTIGVVAENVTIGLPGEGVDQNSAGMIMSVHTLDGNALPDAAFLVSDSSWDCLFVASTGFWPGWTPGQILLQLISEATTRGELTPHAGEGFDDDDDSASNSWSSRIVGSQFIPSFAIEVGKSLMDVLEQMHEEGQVDWHVRPGSLTLDVWAPSSLGSSSGVTLQAGVNLTSLERGATEVYANALCVHWEHGYVDVEDAGEITSYGNRVSELYESEASSPAEATRRGEVELERRIASGWPAVVVTVEPTSTADCPYEAFSLGQTVNVPAKGGGTENLQVLSISVTADENGSAIWTCELGRRWRSVIRKNYDLLKELGGRSGNLNGVIK